jgi:hypothetical protein
MSATLEEARAAKRHAHEVFERLACVAGIGIARVGDGYGLKVNLQCTPDAGVELPNEVDGVPIRLEVVGVIRKA